MNAPLFCQECGKIITNGIYVYSIENIGYALCLKHQVWFSESQVSPEAKALYFALKLRKLPVELEYYHDGHQSIDIAVPARLFLQIDTRRQEKEPEQLYSELIDCYYASKASIPTLKVPNVIVHNSFLFDKLIDVICQNCGDLKMTG